MMVRTHSFSSPGCDSSGTLVPFSTPKRLRLESAETLVFLTLGLMGCTEALAGPFIEGEQLWGRRVFSFSGTRPLSSPAGENSRADGCLDSRHP